MEALHFPKGVIKFCFFFIITIVAKMTGYGQCELSDAGVVFGQQDCGSTSVWVSVFNDEFNQHPSTGNIWDVKGADGNGVMNDPYSTETWYSPDNVSVVSGKLLITAEVEPAYRCFNIWLNANYPYLDCEGNVNSKVESGTYEICREFNYTSGFLQSKEKYLYGKFEIYCKLPIGPGFWPSFWLFGERSNEIDIFEFKDHKNNYPIMTVHYDINNDGDETDEHEGCAMTYESVDYSAGFHKFTLIWDIDKIEWWIDDELKRKINKYYYWPMTGQDWIQCENLLPNINYIRKEELNFPDHPMKILFGFGAQACTYTPNETTQWPAIMEIDYVKVWQRENLCCIPNKIFEATNNLPQETHVSDYIKAGYDAGVQGVAGNVYVLPNQSVVFAAENRIKLLPGFSVAPGANFIARIEDCNGYSNPSGNNIEIIQFPNSFSPDGDGVDDKLVVYVNGASMYSIIVRGNNDINTYYHASNIPINSNAVEVWDGSCNYTGNCGIYHKCNRTRTVHLTFYNCDHSITQTESVEVDCNSKSLDFNDSVSKDGNDKIVYNNIDKYVVDFECFPNPTSHSLNFKFNCNRNQNIKLQIKNSIGTIIYQRNDLPRNLKSFDFSDFSKGLYIISVEIEDNWFHKKVVYN